MIAAVNGGAAGFGCSLALASDIVVAAESAYFLMAFANVGLTLDGGGSALLAARIGHTRASEIGLLAERVSAEQALAWGLVNRVVPDAELRDAAGALAARFAAGPPGSYASTKRTLNAACYPNLSSGARSRGRTPAGACRVGGFSRGSPGIPGEATGAVHRRMRRES